MNAVSESLFMWSLAILVIGVMFSGFAYNPLRSYGKGKDLLETERIEDGLFGEPAEPKKKSGLRKVPLALIALGIIGIIAAIAIG